MYHWVTAVTDMQVVNVLCRGEPFPRVGLPKPETSVAALAMPIGGMAETATQEQTHLLAKVAGINQGGAGRG